MSLLQLPFSPLFQPNGEAEMKEPMKTLRILLLKNPEEFRRWIRVSFPHQTLPEDNPHVSKYWDAPGTASQDNKTLESAASCTMNSVTLGKSTVGKARDEA